MILPDGIYPRVLRIRGLKCSTLIKLVHSLGGILGPAHPFGVATSSAMGFKKMKMSYIKHFDFIETFNTCEFVNSNRLAKDLADRFDMPSFAGSLTHMFRNISEWHVRRSMHRSTAITILLQQ